MKIRKITVKNFRLLEDIFINLEEDITLIVGKNNTGKTSLFEAIHLATSLNGKFTFEDFSLKSYEIFKSSYSLYLSSLKGDITDERKDSIEKQVQLTIPKIQIAFEIEYDKKMDSLNELSEFITDLEDARNDATICVSYEPQNTLRLFQSFDKREDESLDLITYLKDNLNIYYKLRCYAVDKQRPQYKREIEDNFRLKIQKVVLFESIKAMRVLDDTNDDSKRTLAKGFSSYYKQRDRTNQDVLSLEEALKKVSTVLREKYKIILDRILNQLGAFGASTPITIPEIAIESQFDSEMVINNNIRYFYKQGEINLPESYNGLGYSNLIYMILELAGFIEKFKNAKEENLSNFLIISIEEPEAHMHPQMQQIFINQITELIKDARIENNLKIQLMITTHSSHILSESGIDLDRGFNRIRYFNKIIKEQKNKTTFEISIQDFNNLKIDNDEQKTFRFLKQYLTLHKSDLFFADKVIMVEGTTERLLLPLMIKKVAPELCNEYITILEVGGAYAHIFKQIIEFIGVKTLIITDIDSAHCVETNGGKKIMKCRVSEGEVTTNPTLKNWLPKKIILSDLLTCTESEKISNKVRIAFQINENGYNGRSFEDAFINCNKDFLLKEIKSTGKVIKDEISLLRGENLEIIPTPSASKDKMIFAFDIMCFDESTLGEWKVPLYIKEGLTWLAKKE